MTPRYALALLAVLPLAACKDTPSFRVRWNLIDREGDTLEATRALDCTALGLSTIEVTSIDRLGEITDSRTFPCFAHNFEDPEATVAGPSLPAGLYAIEVRGIQRDGQPWRTGEPDPKATPRCDPDVPGGALGCQTVDIACDCLRLDASDDTTEHIGTAVLVAPAECIDGIDNDRDGLVDDQELICGRDPTAKESNNISRVQFRLITTVWDGAPQVTCGELGLITIAARPCKLDEAGQWSCAAQPIASPPCVVGEPVFFQDDAGPGEYRIELTGLDAGGNALTRAELSPSFVVDDTGIGATVMLEASFGVDDFLAPVNDAASFIVSYQQAPDLETSRLCLPDGNGRLVLDQVVYEVRDAHGGPLVAPVSVIDPVVAALDGALFPCYGEKVTLEPLDWGGYTLRVQARAPDGTVCFTTDGIAGHPDAPLSLFPGDNSLVVPRVLQADGTPPPSCEDCDVDGDCDAATPCVDHICQG